ncbi:MAG: LemA family protein [Clostridia bacterium]|nr:LemA family protein [Clostridia bacterium]MBR7100518.1 LemA family protein [Clostridia bacterium]
MLNCLLTVDLGLIIGLVIGAIAIIAVIALVSFFIGTYNGLIQVKNLVEEAWATIDVQLKKRYDLIPNLVETVKGYAAHESKTLESVIAARNLAMTASGDAKMAAENALSGTLKSLFALQESYPDLKANVNFMDLQNQLKLIENEIASARRYYNGTVKSFNDKIEMFPSNLVASMMKFTKRAYFELDSEEERKNVKVQF